MSYDLVKFERGQVWVVRFKNPDEQVGHEPKKDRPWVVLSTGKFNKFSGMVTMAPITTRDEIVTPAQVLFKNDRGQNNVILCENIRTFDTNSGAYIFDYIGSLSDKVLEKVDVSLSIHLGMHYSPITLDKLHESMEAIIKSVDHLQSKNSKVFTDQDVLNFAEKLQELVVPPEEVSASREESIEDTSVPKKRKRIKWTKELRDEYLRDVEQYTQDYVMKKWDIATKNRLYQTTFYVKYLEF